jgi:methylated-DNA-[protein]-cysteine S-methyltransferase
MMETIYFKSPIGTLEIKGDKNGLSSLHFLDSEENQTKEIPKHLQNTITQLQEYFEGTRTDFNLKLNPQGTEFQKKFGNNYKKFLFQKQFLIKPLPTDWEILK